MKNVIKISMVFLFLFSGAAWAQKVKYSKDELKHLKSYYFNEGFDRPARKKVSTVILKDGTEIKGYCLNIRTKKQQIHTLVFEDSITENKTDISADDVAEAYLFASGFEKFGKVANNINRMGTSKRNSMKKATTNDEIYFVNQTVSLKNKKDDQEFLMQLINPEFDDFISVYHDPRASESQGMGLGSVSFGGGVLKSFYVKKGDRIFWLRKGDFAKEYEFLFGDNKEFMKKYPLKSINWDWLSALVLKYTEMNLRKFRFSLKSSLKMRQF